MVCLAWLKIRQTSTRGSTWPGCCCIALLPYKSVVSAEPPQQRLRLCQKCLGGVEVYKVGNVINHRFLPVTWKRQRDGVTLRQRRARFGESDTDKEKESFTTRREGHKHKDTSVNVMTEAGRITEGDRHMNTAFFIKPELEWLWKLEK